MKYQTLLAAAKLHLCQLAPANAISHPLHVFSHGGDWMRQRLSELRGQEVPEIAGTHYNRAGLFKYFLALTAMVGAVVVLITVHLLLLPLAILAFYLVEVHFLFLFPLMIDGEQNVLLKSIAATYRIGVARAVFTVVPIAFYMMAGLFYLKNPLRNWYVGCMAVLIWYEDEMRSP